MARSYVVADDLKKPTTCTGSVALAEGAPGSQGGGMSSRRCRPASVAPVRHSRASGSRLKSSFSRCAGTCVQPLVSRPEERLAERGVEVDHVTVFRWVQCFTPLLVDAARRAATRRQPLAGRRDVREGRGRWRYVYRAVDQHGQIIDVYVSPRRDTTAARRFFEPRSVLMVSGRGRDRPFAGARGGYRGTDLGHVSQYRAVREQSDRSRHGRLKAGSDRCADSNETTPPV